jgi:hypothetical protein
MASIVEECQDGLEVTVTTDTNEECLNEITRDNGDTVVCSNHYILSHI